MENFKLKITPDVSAPSGAEAASAADAGRKTRFTGERKEPRVVLTRATLDELRSSGIMSDGDTDSMISVSSTGSRLSFRDRPMRDSSVDSDDVPSPAPSPAPSLGKRGRGRPPTTGEYVGLAKAKAELNAAKAEEIRLQAERELADELFAKRRRTAEEYSRTPEAAEGLPDLKGQVQTHVDNIIYVASTSKNLKGGHVKCLKEAAQAIKSAFEEMKARNSTEETARLEAENRRQAAELAEARRALAAVGSQQSSPVLSRDVLDELSRVIVQQCGAMINARLESIEERLLPAPRIRPPLAADERRSGGPAEMPTNISVAPTAMAAPVPPPSKPKKKAGKKGPKSTPSLPSQPAASQPAPSKPSEEGWNVVARRKKKAPKKKAPEPAARPPPVQKKAPRKPRLRAPRTTAVSIVLQPAAVNEGKTYEDVFRKAREHVDLAALGIGAGLRVRAAITGARVLQLPASAPAGAADALAAAMQRAVGEDMARVTRPEKCVEMRISGLDDSATKADVVTAVAKVGECPPDAIKAGEIKRQPRRLGSLWLRCPVAAAKKAIACRILVGWSSVQARILEARPLRCFRCLEVGHVGPTCTSSVDRSGVCYRCGQPGHKSAACSAAPKCPVCEANGAASSHRVGAKTCSSMPLKRGAKKAPVKGGSKATPKPSVRTAHEEGGMDTS